MSGQKCAETEHTVESTTTSIFDQNVSACPLILALKILVAIQCRQTNPDRHPHTAIKFITTLYLSVYVYIHLCREMANENMLFPACCWTAISTVRRCTLQYRILYIVQSLYCSPQNCMWRHFKYLMILPKNVILFCGAVWPTAEWRQNQLSELTIFFVSARTNAKIDCLWVIQANLNVAFNGKFCIVRNDKWPLPSDTIICWTATPRFGLTKFVMHSKSIVHVRE